MDRYIVDKDNLNLLYQKEFIDKKTADKYFKILEKHLTYNSEEKSSIVIGGKSIKIPRKQIAYGEPGTFYSFSGNKVEAENWIYKDREDEFDKKDYVRHRSICIIINNIRSAVEEITGKTFNFVLINRYNDGKDYIGFHSDDEVEIDVGCGVAGVSFGAERAFIFKSKKSNALLPEKIELELHHGSLVHMGYPTNHFWKHSLPKRTTVTKPRISLTFRHIKKIE